MCGAAHGVQYIDSPPLAKVIAGQVGQVRTAPPVQVPLITWGGDIATILANGNGRTTQKGSIFDRLGLNLKLVREDDFKKQTEAYVRGDSPYLRGTLGMINMASELLARDPRTRPVIIYQMTWSSGGDALVVKEGIKTVSDLKGKTIAVQAYGPHVQLITEMLRDAGLSTRDVTIKWTRDLTGTDETPASALPGRDVQAATVITPDALMLTSNGTVGTGAEGSVRGARMLLTTKTANRIIADVYAVRSDYLESHRDQVESFVRGLMQAEEQLRDLFKNRESRLADYQKTLAAAAEILLDSPQAVADAEAMYTDCEYVGFKGNVKFFEDPNYPRNLVKLNEEVQLAFTSMGLMGKRVSIDHAKWDYERFKAGLKDTAGVEVQRFDKERVASVITRKQQQGALAEGELFSFEVYFQPNQNTFSADFYSDAFARVVELASTYGGAIISVEGHSDPMGYLSAKKQGNPEVVLGRIKQSAKNLSLTRAAAVRDSVIDYAGKHGIALDESQFAIVGHGIVRPKSGVCGSDPCPPKTEQEWRDNMRVEFRIIQVEAESTVFKPF
jgi:ABC-type nitrate/sulfonate/bicarbonate transport system substrate-binding protein/outer membrane protein OmpA-like peptidoglycan-associated protein